MNLGLLGIVILLVTLTCVGQDNPWPIPTESDYPNIALHGEKVKNFVPAGYKIVSQAAGDLNGDRLPDIALHIKGIFKRFVTKREYQQEIDTNPRILLILFRENNKGGYRLAEQSNVFITTPDSPARAEPFRSMSIRNGILKLDFELWLSAGGWGATNAAYKFRYQQGQFFLIGVDREDYMRNSKEIYSESYNFLTCKVKSTEGIRKNIENARVSYRPPIIKWRTLPQLKPRALKDLGPAFSWEIEADTYL